MRSVVILASVVPVSAFAQPVVSTAGSCPGPVDVVISGISPSGRYAILTGAGEGQDVVPGGPCAGIVSALSGLTLRKLRTADSQGGDAMTPDVPAGVCDDFVQVLDLLTCAASVAVPIGPTCATAGVYEVCTTPYPWHVARNVCASRGAHLVTVDDLAEDLLVSSLTGAEVWIGYNDLETEGVWAWEDGSPEAYTHWATGEPNNAGDEDCAVTNWTGQFGGWNDLPCGSVVGGFVCEE